MPLKNSIKSQTIYRKWTALFLIALALNLTPQARAGAAGADALPEVSRAQDILLQQPHLDKITKPIIINYTFERKGTLEDDFVDDIDLRIDKVYEDGNKDISFNFFTGKRNKPYPGLTHISSNALLFTVLQRDVWEMSRTLGGLANYFSSKIRKALKDRATIEDMTIGYNGREVKAQKISVRPYIDDDNREKFKEYEHKLYEFILSPEVPGRVFMVRTVVPGKSKKKRKTETGETDIPPLVEEILTFKKQTPL